MNMITAEYNIYGGMHFNTGILGTAEILLGADMMDVIVFNDGEDASQMAADRCLSAIMNMTSADYM